MMRIPDAAFAAPSHSNAHMYHVGKEKIVIDGKNTYFSFGNGTHEVKWVFEQLTAQGTQILHLSHYSQARIVNSQQNSVVLTANNSNIKVAEIFSFYQGMIDASVAIENNGVQNVTLIAGFTIMTPHSDKIIANGYNTRTVSNFSNGHSPVLFSPNYWSIDEGNFQVSWRNEMSLLKSGIVSTNGVNNMMNIGFNPVTIKENETYSIDPSISPMIIPIPPGGGGGGGGGSTGSAPSGLSISASPVNTSSGSTITIYPSLQSTGSGGVTVYYQAKNPSGSWESIGSTGYGNNFHWKAKYNYHALRGKASNSYGSTSYSNTVNIWVYNIPQTYTTSKIYDSNGNVISTAVNAVTDTAPGNDTTVYGANEGIVNLYFGTEVDWSSNYNIEGISSMHTNIKSTGEYGFSGSTPSNWFTVYQTRPEGQYSYNYQMQVLYNYLFQLFNAEFKGLVPYFGPYNGNDGWTTSDTPNFSYTFQGTANALVGPPYVVYDPIYNSTGGIDHNLGINTYDSTIHGNSNTNWDVFISYSTSTMLVTNYNGGTTGQSFYTVGGTVICKLYVHSG